MYKVLALIINQLVNIAEIFENAQRAFELLGKGCSLKVLQPVTSLSAKGTDNHLLNINYKVPLNTITAISE